MVVKLSGISQQQARTDTTALLIAKLIEQSTGERQAIEETMEALFSDPERMGSVVLTLMNLVAQYATASGTKPQGLQNLIDFLINQGLREH